MTTRPHRYRDVAICGAYNTKQARRLEGETTESVQLDAALGVLDHVGMDRSDVDGIAGIMAADLAYRLGIGPVWVSIESMGIAGLLAAANAVAAGTCETVLVVGGSAGLASTVGEPGRALRHRTENEFVMSVGLYTAVEFALTARRHMTLYGTKPEHLATIAATIRNNGHVNPQAAYYGKGPFTVDDILTSRLIAEPFHLLDCSMTGEGATALLVTTHERAQDLDLPPVYLHGAELDYFAAPYMHPPSWDLAPFHHGGEILGNVGARAARRAFECAGIKPADIDHCELYDPFSFEVLRQLEAFGFCGLGEGGDFVMDGNIGPDGSLPTNTDGGLLSFNHTMSGQTHAKIARAVEQLQGVALGVRVDDPKFSLCSNGGAGASWCMVAILGEERP